MELEKKLDKVLNILYDESLLTLKRIPTTDIAVFGKRRYGLDMSDTEILLIMDTLQDEGYVIMNKGDFSGSNMKMPTYSLTSKGIRLKQNGGFAFKRHVEWWTNFLIISASIVTIIVGLATSIDFYFKYLSSPSEINNSTENTQTITEPTPKADYNIEFSDTEKTNNDKNCNTNTNQNKMDTITDIDTITDSIKKTAIRPTNK